VWLGAELIPPEEVAKVRTPMEVGVVVVKAICTASNWNYVASQIGAIRSSRRIGLEKDLLHFEVQNMDLKYKIFIK